MVGQRVVLCIVCCVVVLLCCCVVVVLLLLGVFRRHLLLGSHRDVAQSKHGND